MDLTLLLALVGIIVTAIVPFIGYIYKSRKEFKNYYSVIWKNSSKLKAKDLLGERPYEEYYHERSIDSFLARTLERKRNTLIIGPPLSGKTRAAYNSLKKLKKSPNVLVPRSVNMSSFQLPKDYMFWKDKLIFIDDLQYYVEKQDSYHMLFRTAKEKNIPLVATCHSGREFKKVKNRLIEHNLDLDIIFGEDVFELEKISLDEGKKIAEKLQMKWDKVKFNGTIGSIFMRLSEMERRYDQCSNIEKTILLALRNLYLCGVYNDNSIFNIEWIKKLAGKYELEGKDFEWTGWLKSLEDKEFVKAARRNKIWAEDAYLEYIVKPETQSSNTDVFEEVIGVFSDEPQVLLMLGERVYDTGTVDVEISDYMKLSIKAFEKIIAKINKQEDELTYLKAQNYLGQSYWSLSRVENTLDNCRKSILFYNEVLKSLSPEQNPAEYAKIKNRIGNTFTAFAEVENKAENCKTAIDAYHDALRIFTLESDPQEYARVSNNLGGAYLILAEVTEPAVNYHKAARWFNESLKVRSLEDNPKNFATSKNNLANTYARLSEIEDTQGNLEKAIKCYEDVLKISTKEKNPLHYGLTLNNIGNAYSLLAVKKDKKLNSEKAVDAFEKALEARTIDKTPVLYANTMFNLGDAYLVLSEVEDKAENLDKAIESFIESLKVRTASDYPYQHAEVQFDLGRAYVRLAEIEDKSENYNKGIKAFDEALKIFTEESSPKVFEMIQQEIRRAKKIFFL